MSDDPTRVWNEVLGEFQPKKDTLPPPLEADVKAFRPVYDDGSLLNLKPEDMSEEQIEALLASSARYTRYSGPAIVEREPEEWVEWDDEVVSPGSDPLDEIERHFPEGFFERIADGLREAWGLDEEPDDE